jgi:hypothetical protein
MRHIPTLPDRLPFELKPFARLIWVNAQAKEIWLPRLAALKIFLTTLELDMIVAGQRSAGLFSVPKAELDGFLAKATDRGLRTFEVTGDDEEVRFWNGNFNFAFHPLSDFVVQVPNAPCSLENIWQEANRQALGPLFGVPPCCLRFLDEIGHCDAMWAIAGRVSQPAPDRVVHLVGAAAQTARPLVAIGLRRTPHLCCSVSCTESETISGAVRSLASASEAGPDMIALLDEINSWPWEWSALHGIAELKTPILKLCTDTEATGLKYTVRFGGIGGAYPPAGARGIQFPYDLSGGD